MVKNTASPIHSTSRLASPNDQIGASPPGDRTKITILYGQWRPEDSQFYGMTISHHITMAHMWFLLRLSESRWVIHRSSRQLHSGLSSTCGVSQAPKELAVAKYNLLSGMVIFHSYVTLPESKPWNELPLPLDLPRHPLRSYCLQIILLSLSNPCQLHMPSNLKNMESTDEIPSGKLT